MYGAVLLESKAPRHSNAWFLEGPKVHKGVWNVEKSLKSSLVYDFSECSISMYDLDVGFRWNLDTRVA